MYNQYLCVEIRGMIQVPAGYKRWISILDEQTFPNPSKDPTAIQKCEEKADLLRKPANMKGLKEKHGFTGDIIIRSIMITEPPQEPKDD